MEVALSIILKFTVDELKNKIKLSGVRTGSHCRVIDLIDRKKCVVSLISKKKCVINLTGRKK
uniref:Uncharacterized protein n=1 Tax=Romanomermis culicivorax TaxID=13658 RepID=A0A915HNF7_ROMCU